MAHGFNGHRSRGFVVIRPSPSCLGGVRLGRQKDFRKKLLAEFPKQNARRVLTRRGISSPM